MPTPTHPVVDNDLPFIDEHRVLMAAPAVAVWRSLTITDSRIAGVLAHLLGAEPRRVAGSPLGEGSTMPGFAVAEAECAKRVRLTGRHRFSRYTLTLTLAPRPGATLLNARTQAEFPGLLGWCYCKLVIGSGAHRLVMAWLLRGVRRQAEGLRVNGPQDVP